MSKSCRRAAELMTQAQEAPLSTWQWICLYAHLMICGACRRFRKQLKVMRDACAQLRDKPPLEGTTLPDEARERIRNAVKSSPT
jgi:hypothetical protein